MPPHSKTVRGTLDNPKTKEAIAKNEKPQNIGDPVSLRAENDETDRKGTPADAPGGVQQRDEKNEERNHGDNYGLKEGAPSAPSSFEENKAQNEERNHGDNYGLDKGTKSKL